MEGSGGVDTMRHFQDFRRGGEGGHNNFQRAQ